MPDPVTGVADLLPVKPLSETLQDQFNPHLTGAGWDLTTIAVLGVWTAVGVGVAALAWGRQERATTVSRRGRRTGAASTAAPVRPAWSGSATATGRPGTAALVASQVGAALRATRRDPGAVFFAVLLPLGLFALVATTTEAGEVAEGVPFTVHLAAGMATWGLAVTAFMNIPEAVVRARDRGVLKRLRGTPLSPAQYLAGRIVAGLVLGLVIAALVVVLGVAAYDMPVSVTGLALGAGLVALGAVVLAACGFLLAAAVRNARTFGAVALVVLLPVAFLSDVFLVGGPDWMATVGSVFPVKHLQNALTDVLAGVASAGTWWHVAVLVGWGLVAGLLAVRLFRWQPHES